MAGSRSVRSLQAETKWTPVVRRFRASGLSKQAFCRRHRVALSTLDRWCDRLKSAGSGQFVEIAPPTAVGTPASGSWSVEIELPSGARLRFRE